MPNTIRPTTTVAAIAQLLTRTLLTISSPIWVDGARKVQPRRPPGIGEHSDEILRNAGYDEASIQKLRASGAVA